MSLRIEQDGRLRRITLAAPERRNVLDTAASRALLDELREAAADPETGAILLEADGQVFCAGADCEDDQLFTIRDRLSKPLIVAVQGVALSGGLAIVANAHIAIAAQGSSFGLIEIREGRWNERVFRAVARAIGGRRALEAGMTGRIFSTQDALAWGLVHQVAPAVELDDRATDIGTAIANASPDAIREALRTARD
ncbi:MAG TPA: enoyl-CoA hydratase/isomerase family protein [Bryobacteraceae bacterium]|nr:enoyl-CoA hydratase/isomerase family protein [Bryobacteraceae bacterium]